MTLTVLSYLGTSNAEIDEMSLLPLVKSSTSSKTVYYQTYTRVPKNPGVDDGLYITTISGGNATAVLSVSQSGYKNPNWRQQVRLGTQAGTPYVTTRGSMEVTEGEASLIYRTASDYPWYRQTERRFSGCNNANAISASSITTGNGYIKADNQAISRLRAAIRGEQQHMQAAIFLGELGESVRMLRKPFESIQKGVNRYLNLVSKRGRSIIAAQRRAATRKRHRGNTDSQIAEMIRSTWLETSFGWRPLIADVTDIAETIALALDNVQRTQVQGFGTFPSTGIVTSNANAVNGIPTILSSKDTCDWKIKYRAGVSGVLQGPEGSARRLRELAGFRIGEFVPTVWNLLPWSFLADYFFNIGKCIDSDYTCTSSVTWCVKSEVGEAVRLNHARVDHTTARAQYGTYYVQSSGSYAWQTKSRQTYFARSIVPPNNLPEMVIDTRAFSDWNPLKVGNVLALLGAKSNAVRKVLLTTSRG
jgi:hypothetical protein